MSETKNFTPDQFAKFIESLKVTKEGPGGGAGPGGMHGLSFVANIGAAAYNIAEMRTKHGDKAANLLEYLYERCRLAESNAKPSDLAEHVKGFMRAGMDAATLTPQGFAVGTFYRSGDYEEFRRLSEATEVKL